MARKRAAAEQQSGAKISKMGAIRQLLGRGLSNPTEIAARAKKEFGLDIQSGYVSTVKTILKSRAEAKAKAGSTAMPLEGLDAAVTFCEGVGGLKAARLLLEKIERIKKL